MKNHLKNSIMVQLLLGILFLIPLLGQAQIQDKDIEQLIGERTAILQKMDSLERRLQEIDAMLTQVNPEDRLEAMISKYGKNKGKLIASGKVWGSISFEMARDSWGEPDDIQRSEVSSGSTEKWMYPDGKYLFFKNGRLESWKE